MFRIINLHNKNTKLSREWFKGLKDIYKLIDLKNISRLKNSQDSFDIEMFPKFSKSL